jgi:alpha-N-arabinofuranosidase
MKMLVLAGLVLAGAVAAAAEREVTLTVQPQQVIGQIDEKIYGQFLEHIYHSCNGGLWGEVVWNRSFEESRSNEEGWRVVGGVLEAPAQPKETRSTFIETGWGDYEFTSEVRRVAGNDAVLLLFRNEREGYTLALGADKNKRHELTRTVRDPKTKKSATKVVASAAGRLENGRWYPVRIRCEQQHLQVWLDGQPLFDVQDQGGPATGSVGFGSRASQAQFRHLQASALDGRELFGGATPAPARHWRAFGPGTVMLTTNQTLNSRQCLNLTNDSDIDDHDTGVSQAHYCLAAGDTLRGSLWARGFGTLAVQLGDEERVFSRLTDEWKEFPLEFTPKAAGSNATLRISARGKAGLFVDQVSLMPDAARATGGFRPDLLKAVADLRPPIIRWPGGSFIGDYHWKNAIGPQNARVSKKGWDEIDPLSLGVDEFMTLCQKVGAEPVMVICLGPKNKPELWPQYVQDARDLVEYCNGTAASPWGRQRAANGHAASYGVKFWEIDNEVWSMKPEEYVAAVKLFAPALKQADPAIKVIACGSGQLGGHWREGDLAVIERCAGLVDFLSIHHYESPDKFADGIPAAEKFWRELAERIAKSQNPDLKLFVSEWNAQSTDWRTGLYAGGILNAFERCPAVSMATPALWLRHVSAPSWDNALINFDNCGWFPAPNYVVMKLWRDHFAPHLLALEGDAGGLNLTATKTAEGTKLFVKAVNPTDQSINVTLKVGTGFQPKSAELVLVHPGDLLARNTLAQPDLIKPGAAPVQLDGAAVRCTFPPLSAGVVTLSAE